MKHIQLNQTLYFCLHKCPRQIFHCKIKIKSIRHFYFHVRSTVLLTGQKIVVATVFDPTFSSNSDNKQWHKRKTRQRESSEKNNQVIFIYV